MFLFMCSNYEQIMDFYPQYFINSKKNFKSLHTEWKIINKYVTR